MTKTTTVTAQMAWLTALCTATALAGIEELPARAPAMTVQDTPASNIQRIREHAKVLSAGEKKSHTHQTNPTLRCWQYGSLIFEEPLASMPPNLVGQGYVFKGKAGSQSVQLLNIHTATCIIK